MLQELRDRSSEKDDDRGECLVLCWGCCEEKEIHVIKEFPTGRTDLPFGKLGKAVNRSLFNGRSFYQILLTVEHFATAVLKPIVATPLTYPFCFEPPCCF